MFLRMIFVAVNRLVPAPFAIAAAIIVCLGPVPAAAYIGPGAGLSAIGSLLALVAAVFVFIAGFLWYPIKRLMKRRKASVAKRAGTTETTRTEDQGK